MIPYFLLALWLLIIFLAARASFGRKHDDPS